VNHPADHAFFAVLNEVGIIEQLARNAFEAAQEDGLALSHFIVLNHLTRVGDGANPARMANALQLAKGAITNTVARLEARGLVRVKPDPRDGRGKQVWLTKAGRARREAAITAALGALHASGVVLTGNEASALLEPLRALRKRLDAARDRATVPSPGRRPE
jgi:DNA-binding MarR family transcriptional regulator